MSQQQDANLQKGVSPWQDAWRRLKKNKMSMFGLWAVVGMSLISIFGPMLPGVPDPNVQFNFYRHGLGTCDTEMH